MDESQTEPLHRASRGLLPAVLGLLLLLAPEAPGFTGDEHEQISYLALHHVQQRACAEGSGAPEFRSTLAPADFARLVRAVDHFTYPRRLAPELRACREGGRADCRRKLRREPFCTSDFDLDRCAEAAYDLTRRKVDGRSDMWLHRFFAVHRNDDHFRGTACLSYNSMHQRAMELQELGRVDLALAAEAVALHFLQDVLAPGHLITPRGQFSDWQAGAVHDRGNRFGSPVRLGPEMCATAARVVEAGPPPEDPERLAGGPDRLGWLQLMADLDLFLDHCEKGDGFAGYRAHGDRSLMPKVALEDARLHAATVFVLSVRSLEDVYGLSDGGPLQMYFNRPHLIAESQEYVPPRLGLSTDLGIGGDCPSFRGRGSADLLRFEPEHDPTNGYFGHQLDTLQIGFSSWGDARKRWELAWDVLAFENTYLLGEEDEVYHDGWKGLVGVASMTFLHETYADNEAWGVGILSTQTKQVTKHRDFDLYVGWEPGIAQYRIDGNWTTRFRQSLRAGIGMSLVGVEVQFERGLSLAETRRLESEWRWALNLRLRLSPTWLTRGEPVAPRPAGSAP